MCSAGGELVCTRVLSTRVLAAARVHVDLDPDVSYDLPFFSGHASPQRIFLRRHHAFQVIDYHLHVVRLELSSPTAQFRHPARFKSRVALARDEVKSSRATRASPRANAYAQHEKQTRLDAISAAPAEDIR